MQFTTIAKLLVMQTVTEIIHTEKAFGYFLQKLIKAILYYIYIKNKSYRYKANLLKAQSYQEWEFHALKLDKLYRNNKWKLDPRSDMYDYKNARYLLMYLRQLRKHDLVKGLVYTLRSHLSKNVYGIANPILYEK